MCFISTKGNKVNEIPLAGSFDSVLVIKNKTNCDIIYYYRNLYIYIYKFVDFDEICGGF